LGICLSDLTPWPLKFGFFDKGLEKGADSRYNEREENFSRRGKL
jgi:hypothetical protein